MNIQRASVLDVRHGIALVVVVSADIYHQSLTVLVGYCLTHDVACLLYTSLAAIRVISLCWRIRTKINTERLFDREE